jgi:hypothetical protein
MEGDACDREHAKRQGSPSRPSPEHSQPPRATAPIHVENMMSRYKDLALRLAVVASFVLVLAAPFRW